MPLSGFVSYTVVHKVIKKISYISASCQAMYTAPQKTKVKTITPFIVRCVGEVQ